MDVILSFYLHDIVTDKFHQPNIKIDLKLMGMDSDTYVNFQTVKM